MTIHVPPWYLAMMLPAFFSYALSWKRMFPGFTVTGVSQRALAMILLGIAAGGVQSAICWPIYLGGMTIGFIAGKLDEKDGEP